MLYAVRCMLYVGSHEDSRLASCMHVGTEARRLAAQVALVGFFDDDHTFLFAVHSQRSSARAHIHPAGYGIAR